MVALQHPAKERAGLVASAGLQLADGINGAGGQVEARAFSILVGFALMDLKSSGTVGFGRDVLAVDGYSLADPQQGVAHHAQQGGVSQSGQGVGLGGVMSHEFDRLSGQSSYLASSSSSTFAADSGQGASRQRANTRWTPSIFSQKRMACTTKAIEAGASPLAYKWAK